MEFDRWTVLFLLRREEAPELDEKASDTIQDAHLAYLARLHEDGRLAAAGPVEGSSDPRIVGICLFRVGAHEARSLIEADPAVRAGRLRVDVLSWSVPRGALTATPSRFPRSMADVDVT
jgi:uncharacterized protein YciI